MIGKLMKHEFRATGRVGLPLCGVMIALSVLAGMVIRFWGERDSFGFLENAGAITIILYVMSVFAVSVGIFAVLMQHFKRNLLEDEGYLMRTLPVSIHELLLSKLFVALIWYVAAMALIALSGLFVGVVSGAVDELRKVDVWSRICEALAAIGPGYVIGTLVEMFCGMALFTLLFYADFTISQTFSRHKLLYSIVFVVVFIILVRLFLAFNGFLTVRLYSTANGGSMIVEGPDLPTEIFITRNFLVEIAELLLINVGVYFLTWGFLKYRPNLE